MENDNIRFAFQKVKQDISLLSEELYSIKSEIDNLNLMLKSLHEELATQKLREIAQIPISTSSIYPADSPTHTSTNKPTDRQINPTHSETPTDNPTVPQEVKGLKSPFLGISTGNEGVPTDRQTDRQTNQQTEKPLEINIKQAHELLDSLDTLKKEIRLKFKRITNQEMSVFSTIYQLEEQDPENTTYKKVALALKLSESSIRDYTQKIINKGIPIKKQKINNKKIILSISPELKKIATLSTIIRLREL